MSLKLIVIILSVFLSSFASAEEFDDVYEMSFGKVSRYRLGVALSEKTGKYVVTKSLRPSYNPMALIAKATRSRSRIHVVNLLIEKKHKASCHITFYVYKVGRMQEAHLSGCSSKTLNVRNFNRIKLDLDSFMTDIHR